jgi:hypothetical protein
MYPIKTGNVISYYFDVEDGWEQTFFLISDVHWDSVLCNRDLFLTHLQQAERRQARILSMGDFFDAMQGRFDPRRSMTELRPEYRREDYYDFVITDTAKLLEPQAHLIDMMGRGNHESAVLKNAQTSLLDRLVTLWNYKLNTQMQVGGYGGWIRFMFNMSGGKNTGPRTSIKMKYYHGSGGDAPVTRGVIHTNRQAVYLPDADIVVNGHNHNAYYIPITRERLSNKGVQYFDTQHHLRIPGYKQAYADGSGGWEIERGGVPKPLGAWWLTLRCEGQQIVIKPEPQIDNPLPVNPIESEDLMPYPQYAEDPTDY